MIKNRIRISLYLCLIISIFSCGIVNAKEYTAKKNEVSSLLFSSKKWMDDGGDIFKLDNILQATEILIYEEKDKLIDLKIKELKSLLAQDPIKQIGVNETQFLKFELEGENILFNRDGYLYIADKTGANIKQASNGKALYYNNYALSLDQDFLAIIYQVKNNKFLEIVDLAKGKRLPIATKFSSISDKGLMFDNQNRLYFIAAKTTPFPNATTDETKLINNNFNEIYRVNFDGTNLEKVTDDKKKIEGSFSFSEDYQKIIYTTKHSETTSISYFEIMLKDLNTMEEEVLYKHKDPMFNPIILDEENIIFSQLIDKERIIKKLSLKEGKSEVKFDIAGFAIMPVALADEIIFQEISLKDDIIFNGVSKINSDGSNYKKIIFNAKTPKAINARQDLDLSGYKNIKLIEILDNKDFSLSARFFDIKNNKEIIVNFPKKLISDAEKAKIDLIKASKKDSIFRVTKDVNGYVGYFENWAVIN